MHVAAAGCFVDGGAEGVVCGFAVDEDAGLIGVAEVAERPFEEVLDVAEVLGSVEGDEVAAFVLVEETFVLCLCFLEVLVPLGREELEHSGSDTTLVLLF